MIDAQLARPSSSAPRLYFSAPPPWNPFAFFSIHPRPSFPNGLANSSGELGHNLMDHVKTGGADGTLPGMEDRHIIGRRPNGIYIPRFRNVKTKQP